MGRNNFFHLKRMGPIDPVTFEADMELVQWRLSKRRKRITGTVLHGPTSEHEKKEYSEEILSILFQHGHILLRTAKHDIICWGTGQ